MLSHDLQQMRQSYLKTVIYCHSYSLCAELYKLMMLKMGSSFTEPCGYLDLHQFRLLDMYTRISTKGMNEKVLTSFLVPSGLLRVLIATAAFSMGIDCQDIHCVMHYGAPATVT